MSDLPPPFDNMVNQVDGIEVLNANVNYDLCSHIYGETFNEFSNELNIECNYASEQSAINMLSQINEPLFTIFNLNCRSLTANFSDILSMIFNFKQKNVTPQVFCLQETWLHSNSNLDFYTIEDYDFYSKSRSEGRGGGVGTYVKSCFKCEEIFPEFYTQSTFESLCLNISYNGFKAIVVNIYRAPINNSEHIETFFNILLELFEKLDNYTCPIFLVGDLNINLFTITDALSNATKLIDYLTMYGYLNVILRATRIQNFSFSLLDVICCKDFIQNFCKSIVVANDISDHFLTVSAYFEKNLKPPKRPSHFEKRFLEDENYEALNNALNNQDWSEVTALTDVNLSYAKFLAIFLDLYNLHCPKVTIRNNKRTMPQEKFMNRHLLTCKKFKENLYRIQINYPNDQNISRYRRYRNQYFRAVKRAKKLYYHEQIKSAGGDSRKLWSVLREVLKVNQNRKEMDYLEVDGIKITDKTQIADKFNQFFSSLGTKLTPEIPRTNKDFRDYLPPRIENSIFIRPLTEHQTFELITNCKPKESKDINDVSSKLLIRCAACLSVPLTYIYNLSFSSGIFPCLMKVSKCVIIYKSGPISLLDSYRGVSMIDSFSKPMEQYMYKCVYDFLDEQRFWNVRQFGFRRGHSTTHNILSLMNLVTEAFGDKKVCAIVLLDIKKCFDLVCRSTLLYKLNHYGIRGRILEWFTSYYQGRKQRVYFRGGFSLSIEEIVIGVLQGSCLGVLTFIIFINDLDSSSRDAIFNLFCDDTLIFLKSDTFRQLIEKINNVMPEVNDWYRANKLIINSLKTKIVLFETPRQVISPEERQLLDEFPIYINNNHVGEDMPEKIFKLDKVSSSDPEEKNQSARHLGVFIDQKLNFKSHFNKMYKRLQRAIFSLRIMKHLLDLKHLKMLYSSYIKSIIEYSIIIFTAVPDSIINSIKQLQKQCVRIITRSSGSAPSAPLFKQLQILPYKELRDFQIGLFMHKFMHGKSPPIFNDLWNYRRNIHTYHTRQRDFFHVDVSTRSYIQNSPLNYFPNFFNTLPVYLKRIENFNEFKRKLFIFQLNKVQ